MLLPLAVVPTALIRVILDENISIAGPPTDAHLTSPAQHRLLLLDMHRVLVVNGKTRRDSTGVEAGLQICPMCYYYYSHTTLSSIRVIENIYCLTPTDADSISPAQRGLQGQ